MSGLIGSGDTNRTASVVALEFWKEYDPDPARPGEVKECHYVKWSRRGDFTYYQMQDKVSRLKKPTPEGGEDPIWTSLRPAYEAWASGQEVPVNGTPLDAWAALTKKQVVVFRAAKYTCIEDVAAMTDNDLPAVRLPEMRRIRDTARAYLENRKGSSHIEAAMAAQNSEIATLKAELAEAIELLKAATPVNEPV